MVLCQKLVWWYLGVHNLPPSDLRREKHLGIQPNAGTQVIGKKILIALPIRSPVTADLIQVFHRRSSHLSLLDPRTILDRPRKPFGHTAPSFFAETVTKAVTRPQIGDDAKSGSQFRVVIRPPLMKYSEKPNEPAPWSRNRPRGVVCDNSIRALVAQTGLRTRETHSRLVETGSILRRSGAYENTRLSASSLH